MNKIFILSFLLIGLFFQNCSTEECGTKQWVTSYIQKPGESKKDIISALIDDQTLLLLSPQSYGKQLVMVTSKETLQGDFTASFRYQDLQFNDVGMGLVVLLAPNSTPDTTFYGGIFYSGLEKPASLKTLITGTGEMQDGGTVIISSSVNKPKDLQDKSAGTISIERMGNQINVTIAPDGEAPLSYSNSMPNADPIRIAIQFGNFANTKPSNVSTARITNFSVIGGGGAVQNDEFTCNTLE